MDVDEDSEQLSTHDVEAPDDLDDKASSEEEINVSEVEEVVGAEAPQASYGNTKSKKPPTGEELRTIKEASDLYKSNTFKLQVSNMTGKCELAVKFNAAPDRRPAAQCPPKTVAYSTPRPLPYHPAHVYHVSISLTTTAPARGFPCTTRQGCRRAVPLPCADGRDKLEGRI